MNETDQARQEYEAKLAEHAQLARTWVSTLQIAPLDFDHVGLIVGKPAATIEEAVANLQRRAIEVGASAVLGASFLPYAEESAFVTTERTRFVGYGTAVKWRIPPQDVPPGPPSASQLGWVDPTQR